MICANTIWSYLNYEHFHARIKENMKDNITKKGQQVQLRTVKGNFWSGFVWVF